MEKPLNALENLRLLKLLRPLALSSEGRWDFSISLISSLSSLKFDPESERTLFNPFECVGQVSSFSSSFIFWQTFEAGSNIWFDETTPASAFIDLKRSLLDCIYLTFIAATSELSRLDKVWLVLILDYNISNRSVKGSRIGLLR
jgi:hypothetical protein